MEIAKTETHTTIEVTYRVTGAPLLLKKYTKARNYQPDTLRVEFFDGEPVRVKLAGPRILKSGLAGERLDESFGTRWDRDSIPTWVEPYLVLDK